MTVAQFRDEDSETRGRGELLASVTQLSRRQEWGFDSMPFVSQGHSLLTMSSSRERMLSFFELVNCTWENVFQKE